MAARPDKAVFHIGPERDLPIFDGLGLNFVPLEQADYVVCTGLRHDEVETPESYRAELGELRRRRMFMLCGNPDLVVERGEKLIYCAGALADLYGTLGGEVLYAGKPHRPIYDLALERVAALRGAAPARKRVLAIGDSVRTDLNGATDFGIDCLFVTAGIHAEELGDRHDPESGGAEPDFRRRRRRAEGGHTAAWRGSRSSRRLRRQEHRVDLVLERLGVERLDDVVVHAGLLGGDDVLGLGFGGDHDERRRARDWGRSAPA